MRKRLRPLNQRDSVIGWKRCFESNCRISPWSQRPYLLMGRGKKQNEAGRF